ncbi:GPI transamidase component GPI16 [Babesia ovis]|uniref:GPI transamidase component GPI16 n=1 Tax=Babesia ovis TaxID=5869 RepID=A0A9W5T9J0_BABOV|nr:GPI transamidase component GPI16 [Babesia ovis]
MFLYQFWATSILVFATCLKCEPDVVEEKLTVQPLKDGNFLYVLDVSIATGNYLRSDEQLSFPGVLMDVMAPDLAILYYKAHVEKFESTQHMGDWQDTWGKTEFEVFNHGETLWATWSEKHTLMEAYDYFETLALSLWGITGSQFYALVSRNSYVFDVSRIASVEADVPGGMKHRSLSASYSEDVFCVDNLYKWRTMMPSMGQRGLLSLVNDERAWSRSGYKGVRARMFMEESRLYLTLQFQLFVNRKHLKKGLWNIYREGKIPAILPDASKSIIEFVVPMPLEQELKQRVVFDYLDPSTHDELDATFTKLFALTENVPSWPQIPELALRVTELESTVLPVQRRVQSSLSVVVDNPTDEHRYVKFVQPLPYYILPQIHTLVFKVVGSVDNTSVQERRLLWSCTGADCFNRIKTGNTKSPEDIIPLMIYEITEYWIAFGFSTKLPKGSTLECRIDLQKNKLKFDEIDYSMHRGQLIHSGLLIHSAEPRVDDLVNFKGQIQYSKAFFSHIVLPDNTMSFNVMGAVGVIVGLLYSAVFHTATARHPLDGVTLEKKTN